MSASGKDFPNDVCDCWEMDRQEAGWFFDNATRDDWGCGWKKSDVDNMGQVVSHPLADWSRLSGYRPPNPRNPFYFSRIESVIREAGQRYVVLTSHFNLIERLHMLRGFARTMQDFVLEPEKTHRLLEMILEYKISHLDEAARRFGDRVHGILLTDDWGTQQGTFVSSDIFEEFFRSRYRRLFDAIHGHGWHVFLHSCGKITEFVPFFIELGVDVLNMQQPRTYGIRLIGERFAGRVCFLTTVDIQTTLPAGDPETVRAEAGELVARWSTPKGASSCSTTVIRRGSGPATG